MQQIEVPFTGSDFSNTNFYRIHLILDIVLPHSVAFK